MTCPALQFLILTVASWLNRHQVAIVEYLIEENRVLRDQLKGQRLRLTDAQPSIPNLMTAIHIIDHHIEVYEISCLLYC